MKLGIMQPYFFPYIGYWALIKYTDKWVVFDTPQYIRHGWINRNRVLKPMEGWQYITIPLKKHERETIIKDIVIDNSTDWKDKIVRQLMHYKKFAPHYSSTISLIEKCLSIETDSVTDLNVHIIRNVCDYLHIPFNYEVFSGMSLSSNMNVSSPDEWSLEISKAIGASEYINPPGGQEFFNRDKFSSNNINLRFLKVTSPLYTQSKREFIPDLSIIDNLMFNDVETVNAFLDNYILE